MSANITQEQIDKALDGLIETYPLVFNDETVKALAIIPSSLVEIYGVIKQMILATSGTKVIPPVRFLIEDEPARRTPAPTSAPEVNNMTLSLGDQLYNLMLPMIPKKTNQTFWKFLLGKIVGMLLEGIPEEELIEVIANRDDLIHYKTDAIRILLLHQEASFMAAWEGIFGTKDISYEEMCAVLEPIAFPGKRAYPDQALNHYITGESAPCFPKFNNWWGRPGSAWDHRYWKAKYIIRDIFADSNYHYLMNSFCFEKKNDLRSLEWMCKAIYNERTRLLAKKATA
jgi:hypothetical protein